MKAHLRAIMSWTTVVETREVALVDFTLSAGLGMVVGLWEMWCLRAGRGCDGVAVSAVYH